MAESCLALIGFASHSYDSFHLVMLLFACRRWTGSPRAVEGGTLQWVRPNHRNHPMPAADRLLIPILQDLLVRAMQSGSGLRVKSVVLGHHAVWRFPDAWLRRFRVGPASQGDDLETRRIDPSGRP